MNYVAQDDIILAVDANINLIRGESQKYSITLFKDSFDKQLNASNINLISIAILKSNGSRALLYSNEYIAGVSDTVEIGRLSEGKGGVVSFEINEDQSLLVEAGDLMIAVTVTYQNFYPNSKTYKFPPLKIGSTSNAVQGPGSIDAGTGGAAPIDGGNTGGNTGNPQQVEVTPQFGQHEYEIEFNDGSNPTGYGKLSINAERVQDVTEITYVMLDSDLVRISSLENFLQNRLNSEGSRGTITIYDKNNPEFYSIFNIEDWARVDLTPGNGDSEDSDGITINVKFESVSTGPGVSKNTLEVGDTTVYSLDGYGLDAITGQEKGILTYVDKNIQCEVNTDGNEYPTGIRITYSPFHDSYITVEVNGVSVEVGSGTKNSSVYFSSDNGATALTIEEIRAGDQLIWNGINSGFELESGDDLNLIYEALADDIR